MRRKQNHNKTQQNNMEEENEYKASIERQRRIIEGVATWEEIRVEFERLKSDHRLNNATIAKWFGYSGERSFNTAKRNRKVVQGIVTLWLVTA